MREIPWFKVDDQFWSHPKVVELSADAVALWVRAGSYAAQHLTDGVVTYGIVRMLGADRDAATELTNAFLWDQKDGRTWVFHDWEDYQPDAIASKERRQKKQDASALGNHERWHVARGIRVEGCSHCIASAIPGAIRSANPEGIPPSPSPSPSPDYYSPPMSQSLDNRARDATDELSQVQKQTAAQHALSPERIRDKVHAQLGIALTLVDALALGMHVCSKTKEWPRTPTPYVLRSISLNPAEIEKHIYDSGLA